jgi:hypothetical protein
VRKQRASGAGPELVEHRGRPVLDFGGGIRLPATGTFMTTFEDHYDVSIGFAWFEGQWDAGKVCVTGREGFTVTGEVLRRVPVERLLREGLVSLLREDISVMAGVPSFQGREADLASVAAAYRLAYMAHEPPVRAVAAQFGLSQSMAAKRVMQAREEGLLPPTTKGKAGA